MFDQFAPVLPGDPVEHPRGIERTRYRAAPLLAIFEQPPEQDGIALVSLDALSVRGDGADAVRVTVVRKAGVALFAHDRVLQRAHMRLDGLRIDPREQRVDLAPDLDDVQT